MSRLGVARPLSTKLRWRCEMPASKARSSWLRRRRCRQLRSWAPIGETESALDGITVSVMRRLYHLDPKGPMTREVIGDQYCTTACSTIGATVLSRMKQNRDINLVGWRGHGKQARLIDRETDHSCRGARR